jgi:hypothetical protein
MLLRRKVVQSALRLWNRELRMKASCFFLTVGIGLAFTPKGFALGHECPPGQVWGGQKCEWRDLCPDGQPPAKNGECERGEATPPPASSPAPARTPLPEPIRCPDGSVASSNGCQPPAAPCPPGKIAVNGRCSFQMRNCDRSTVFSRQESSGRSVVFVNGDLVNLFNRYFADAERSKVDLDLDRLKVIFFDTQNKRVILEGGNNVKMDIGQLFAGMTMKQVWLRKLRRYKSAFDLSDPVAEAGQFGGDLLCGPRE